MISLSRQPNGFYAETCFEDTLRGQGARCLLCRDSTPVPFRVALITQPRQQQLQYRDVHELFPDALNAEPDELGPADLEDDRDSDSFDDSAIYGPEFEDHDDDSDYSSTPSGNYPDRSDCVLHSASNSEESNSSVEPESGSDNMGEGLFGAGQVSILRTLT